MCPEINVPTKLSELLEQPNGKAQKLKSQSLCRWLLGTSSAISIWLSRHLSVPANTPPAWIWARWKAVSALSHGYCDLMIWLWWFWLEFCASFCGPRADRRTDWLTDLLSRLSSARLTSCCSFMTRYAWRVKYFVSSHSLATLGQTKDKLRRSGRSHGRTDGQLREPAMQPFGTFVESGVEAFQLAFTFRAHLFSAAMRIIKNLIRIICELFFVPCVCLATATATAAADAAKRCSKSLTKFGSACHASPSDYDGHFKIYSRSRSHSRSVQRISIV